MLVWEWRKFQQPMADSINNRSKNKEVADQFSVWITRRQGNQTNAIAPPLSPSRWRCAKTNAADTGIAPPYSLRHRHNLTSVSKVCEAEAISLSLGLNGVNELSVMRFKFPFILIGKSTMAFLKGQSWRVGPEQGFQRCFADRLNQSLVSSVAQANHRINIYYASIGKLLSELEIRFSGNDQEILCVLGNTCHIET